MKTDKKQERKGKVGDLQVLSVNQSENWCNTRKCIRLKVAQPLKPEVICQNEANVDQHQEKFG